MKALKKDSQIYMDHIVTAIETCYTATAKTDNKSLTALYNEIGKQICLQSEKAFVSHLAELLKNECPQFKGFSARNIRRMREFYLRYENTPKLKKIAFTLNWTQNSVILEMCDIAEETEFYLNLTSSKKLSKLALISAIESKEIEQEPVGISVEHRNSTAEPVCDFIDTTAVDTTMQDENHCSKNFEGVPQGMSLLKGISQNKDNIYDWTVFASTINKEVMMAKPISNQTTEVEVVELFHKIKSERAKYEFKQSLKEDNPKMANEKCFGYDRTSNGELTVNHSETEVVELIFKLYIEGNSLVKIIKALKEQEILSPTGKSKWNKETLYRLIFNKKYVVQAHLGKAHTQNGKQIKNNEESEKAEIKNHHIAIIPIEQFETAQALKEERSIHTHQSQPPNSMDFRM